MADLQTGDIESIETPATTTPQCDGMVALTMFESYLKLLFDTHVRNIQTIGRPIHERMAELKPYVEGDLDDISTLAQCHTHCEAMASAMKDYAEHAQEIHNILAQHRDDKAREQATKRQRSE